MAKPTFRRGGEAAEEAAKQRNSSSRNKFFTIKEDRGTAVIRLIDDGDPKTGWISTYQHSYVPTKGPDDTMSDDVKAKWPKRSGAVCRHDKAFKEMYKDCYICDNMQKEDGKKFSPSIRLWGRAVLREPILGTQEHVDAGLIKQHEVGEVVGYDDVMVQDADSGEMRPDVVILNFSMNNFFGALNGYYAINRTVLDRDFHVTRKGMGTDTEYVIVARDPIYNANGSRFDLRDPETRAKYLDIVDLEEVVAAQASDDHYARYFDPSQPIPDRRRNDEDGGEGGDKAKGGENGTAPAPTSNEPDEEQMKAMRARVKGGLTLTNAPR